MVKKKGSKKKDSVDINIGAMKEKAKGFYEYLAKNEFFKKWGMAIIIILILMTLAFTIRAQTADLPLIEESAHSQVEQMYMQQIEQQVRAQNPGITEEQLAREVETRYSDFYNENREQIDQEKAQTAAQFKQDFTDPRYDYAYLSGIDPYHYWRYMQNYMEQGYVFDYINEDGNYVDALQHAPQGNERGTRQVMHPVYTTWTYNVLSTFNPDIEPYQIFYLMPAIVAMLTVIPAFFIGRKLGGNTAGAIAGFIVAVHQSFISRSVGGFSSTDSYNILFPLMIFWMVVEAFDAKEYWKKITFGGLAGLFTGIFASVWSAWWFVFILAMAVLIGYPVFLIVKKLVHTKDYKNWSNVYKQLATAGTVFVSSALFVSLFRSWSTFSGFIDSFLGRLEIQHALGDQLWPNVLTTVAELNPASPTEIVSAVGGGLLFFTAFIGLILTLLPLQDWRKQDYYIFGFGVLMGLLFFTELPSQFGQVIGISFEWAYTFWLIIPILAGFIAKLFDDEHFNVPFAIFASVWFTGMVFTAMQGTRFLLLLVPAVAIALAVSFGRILQFLYMQSKNREINPAFAYALVIIIAGAMLYPVVVDGNQAAEQRIPSMNDGWHNTLTNIQDNTDEDAIITSWWDFGHWFKEMADRPVTFDGASQNTPMAYWVGKALSTGDEREFLGVSRMLNCGSREGFERLALSMHGHEDMDALTADEFFESKEVIDEAIMLDREEAENLYGEHVPAENVSDIAEYTHCDAPESLWITSGDMVGKGPVWGHFGAWSFERSYIVEELRHMPLEEASPTIQDILNTDSDRAQELYLEANSLTTENQISNWISERPNYLTNQPFDCEEEDGEVICEIGSTLQRGQGQVVELSGAVVDLESHSESHFVLRFVDEATGNTLSRERITPTGVVINRERTDLEGGEELNVDIAIKEINGQYEGILAHEKLSDSMFTNLYFWEGEGIDSLERIHTETDRAQGYNIYTWRVTDWDV